MTEVALGSFLHTVSNVLLLSAKCLKITIERTPKLLKNVKYYLKIFPRTPKLFDTITLNSKLGIDRGIATIMYH